MVEVAPEEIKADAETVSNGVVQITDLLIAAGGDETQVDQGELGSLYQEFLTGDFDAATGRLTAWRAGNCS